LNVNFSVIAEAMTEGVYEWNISDGTLNISPRLVEIIGLGDAELTAEDWNHRIHPDDFEGYKIAIERHLKAETDRLLHEYRIRRAIGDYLWIADSGRCLRRDNGEAVRLIGAVRDITGRKLAEKRLREAQEVAEAARKQLQDAIESISQGLVMFDKDDRVILFNSIYRGYFAGAAGEEVAAMIKPGALFWDFFRA
jgi:PAS domain S-box-containing protein